MMREPEPAEFGAELDRDLLALAADLEIHGGGELLKPAGTPAAFSTLVVFEDHRAPGRREEFLRRLTKG